MFPEGLVGVGLLLMRAACGLATVATVYLLAPMPLWADAGLVILAGGLVCGVLTRPAAIIGAGLQVVVAVAARGSPGAWFAALAVLNLAALSMTGPGAYSIDTRLFGRKVITLGPLGGEEHGD